MQEHTVIGHSSAYFAISNIKYPYLTQVINNTLKPGEKKDNIFELLLAALMEQATAGPAHSSGARLPSVEYSIVGKQEFKCVRLTDRTTEVSLEHVCTELC